MYGSRWQRTQYPGTPRRRIGGRFLIAAALAIMAVVGYVGQKSENEITGETQHVALTREQEVALGLEAVPQVAAEFGGLLDHPIADYVAEVGERVALGVGEKSNLYDYEFHVLADDQTVNAFALPGGQIFVTVAMLRSLDSEAELAGVLGHEVGHVVGRHGAEHLAKQQLGQGLVGAAGVASWDPDNPSSAQAAMVAAAVNQLVQLRYSRSDELESDELGVRFLTASKYDPGAMIGVMQALQRASKGRSAQPEFFQTHPDPENRIARLRELVGDHGGSGDLGEERYRDRVLLPLGERANVSGRE